MAEQFSPCPPLSEWDRSLLELPLVTPLPQVQSRSQEQSGTFAFAGGTIRYSVLTSLTTVTVNFHGRLQRLESGYATVAEQIVATAAGGIQQVSRDSSEGWYSAFAASILSGTATGTQVYVLVELGTTLGGVFSPYAILLQGYITNNQPLDTKATQGTGAVTNPAIGLGAVRVISVSDPAAGAEWTHTVPAGVRWRFNSLHCRFVTSGTAATRRSHVEITDGTDRLMIAPPGRTQAASLTHSYVAPHNFVTVDATTGVNPYGIVFGLILLAGWDIFSVTTNIQAGDQYSLIRLVVEEFPEV